MIEIESIETEWSNSEWNPANFEKVVLAYQSKIYNFLYSMLKQKPLVEDITQETFFLAYRNLCSKTVHKIAQVPNYNFNAWLYTIARNAAISEKRRHKTIYSYSSRLSDDSLSKGDYEINAYELLKAPAKDIDKYLDIHEELEKAIQKVGRQNLLPLLLHIDGFSYKEICQINNVSLPSVKTSIYRAKERLRTALVAQSVN
jgi:RNA polymerase sigma-70 factor (ECF subfamily)